MTYKKETCKYCETTAEYFKKFCPKCNGWGFINVAERPAPNKLKDYSNRPPSTPDINNRSFI